VLKLWTPSASWRRARTLQHSRSNAETEEIGETQNQRYVKFRQVVDKLRRSITQIQAVILVGPQGVVDYVLDDPALNLETIAGEYATLLRIARSASEDSGAGNIVENVLVSEKSVMIARNISPDHYLILLSRAQDQIGRARYELKQVAREIRV
jgi:predicted regulator of Ras-like GTPase activity (Roadblock/LC7/MglB family)